LFGFVDIHNALYGHVAGYISYKQL
jgi:hypothetical protein